MNEIRLNIDQTVQTTNAAEGLPRRRLTVAELERMTEAGILLEDERIELIGGEVVPMSPKGDHHDVLKSALTIYCAPRLPKDLVFVTETTFRLDTDAYLEPDFVFYPKGGRPEGTERFKCASRRRDCRFEPAL